MRGRFLNRNVWWRGSVLSCSWRDEQISRTERASGPRLQKPCAGARRMVVSSLSLLVASWLIGSSNSVVAQVETEIVPWRSVWSFLHPQDIDEDPTFEDPDFTASWTRLDYDEEFPVEWSGPAEAPFWYGGIVAFGDLGTELNDPGPGQRFAGYFRHSFTTDEDMSNLFLDFVADDGVAFYLDGEEIARDSCCIDVEGFQADGFETFSPFFGFENVVRRFPILEGETLAAGPHVLAVEIHDIHPLIAPNTLEAFFEDESDFGFDARIISRPEPVAQLVEPESRWHFFRGVGEPSPGLEWTGSDFEDGDWEFAKGGFGYDRDNLTFANTADLTGVLLQDMFQDYTTVYLRQPFSVTNPDGVERLELNIDYDDAFIAYINGVEVARSDFGTPGLPEPFDATAASHESTNGIPQALVETFSIDLSALPNLLRRGEDNILAIQGVNRALNSSDFVLAQISLNGFGDESAGAAALQAGDANQDLEFNQLDLVQVQVASKYLTGRAATWGDGDWNAAPGGTVGDPPRGDGLFNQIDIVNAQLAGVYLTGPYSAVRPNGVTGDSQASLGYDPATGEVWVDAPNGVEMTSINIDSASGIFVGEAAENLGGSFDNDADSNIFKATFGASFGSISFGNVAQVGLTPEFLLSDLSAVGSLQGGGPLNDVDLIYVPEPGAMTLLWLALVGVQTLACRNRTKRLSGSNGES